MNPGIVISAYNRPDALSRLLESIQSAEYPETGIIPLVISIDHAVCHPEVVRVASRFSWKNGPKKLILHTSHLGPIDHFYKCGELSRVLGAIIYLEDDLMVSPVFYPYASQALTYFQNDARIGGISLYALWFNGYTQEPFTPLVDEADHFFIQVPYTQGQAFTERQWSRFRNWTRKDRYGLGDSAPIHEAWFRFRDDEWFPQMARYLVASDRYFVFPRTSFTTGMGNAGTHFRKTTAFFQTPLQLSKDHFSFKPIDQSSAVYDSFFEILPDRLQRLAPRLNRYSFTVDLYATRTRKNIPTEYVLTSRPCRKAVMTFSLTMQPQEANVIFSRTGNGISLCKKDDLRWNWLSVLQTRQRKAIYFAHGRRLSKLAWLVLTLLTLR